MRVSRHIKASLIVTALLIGHAWADDGMRIYPPDAVFSPQKLERITDYFGAEVANGKISGAIVLVQRHGKQAILNPSAKST